MALSPRPAVPKGARTAARERGGSIVHLGLFGGSFDPPHLAHLALARAAKEQLALDRVLWQPAGQPWQKKGQTITSAEHRCTMVELLLKDEPDFELDTRELQRSGPSYTLDTVRELQAENPKTQLQLIIGQDQYAHLHTWHGWRELLNEVTLAVAAREDQAVAPGPELALTPHFIRHIKLPPLAISSTQIRAMASRGGNIAPLVGDAVAGYIAQHRLYSEH